MGGKEGDRYSGCVDRRQMVVVVAISKTMIDKLRTSGRGIWGRCGEGWEVREG